MSLHPTVAIVKRSTAPDVTGIDLRQPNPLLCRRKVMPPRGYIGTAERLAAGFLYDKIADSRVFGTRCGVATLAALIARRWQITRLPA
jgi:hypothetical protein